MIDSVSQMRLKIAMVVFSYYPSDPRVRREAEALADSGMCVDVICLRDRHELKKELVNGVRVYRLPLQRRRAGKLSYIWQYAFFMLLSFIALSVLYIYKHYRIVHVHNMPDVLAFCALIPKLFGSGLILDLHDPMPEVFISKYSISNNHPVIRLLRFCQYISVGFADLVLTVNEACRELFISYGCPEEKIHVIMNSPQESIFHISTQKNESNDRTNKYVVMYHGTIVERNGLGVALKAIARISNKIPNLIFEVYGDGDFTQQFLHLVGKLHLEDVVRYHGHVSAEVIATSMKYIDVGLIPCTASIHWEYAIPTRVFEYLCMGKPVIAPKTKGILDYFDDTSMFFYEAGNEESMGEMILEVNRDQKKCRSILDNGILVYQKHKWSLQRNCLIKHYNSLILQKRYTSFRGKIKKLFLDRI
jgi:glycosyltransferase involved in cell wall biosynthesis